MDTLHLPSLVSGGAGVGTLAADIIPHDTVGTILKIVVALVSLIPTLKNIFSRKQKTN